MITRDARDVFALRLGNLNKLKKCLEKFYNEIMNVPHTRVVEHIEISAIARNGDTQNLISLIELVMGAVVNCEAKETYISRILEMNEEIQAELMVFIQRILSKLQDSKVTDDADRQSILHLRQENRSLCLQLEELRNNLNEIVSSQAEFLKEKDDYISRIKILEDDSERKNNRRSQNSDMTFMQLESQLNQKDSTIENLKTQLSDFKKESLKETSALKDELDVSHEKLIQLNKIEQTLEQYKKRLEDVNVYKKKIKDLQDDKDTLEKTLKGYEEEENGAHDMKQNLAFYKEQHAAEKERAACLSLSLEEKERLIKELQKSKKDLEEKKYTSETEIKELKSEIEFLRSGNDTGRESEDSFSLHKGMQSELEDTIKRLETENKILKGQSGNKGLIQEINEQMDSILVSKKIAEDQLAHEKRDHKALLTKYGILEKDYNELSEKFNDLQQDLTDINEENQNFKSKIQNLEKEKASLEHVQSDYEKIKSERDLHIQEMKNLYRDKDETTQKLIESKENTHKLETIIIQKETFLKAAEIDRERIENKLREAYESERIAISQLDILKRNRGHSDETQTVDKIKYLEFERDIMKLNSENTALKLTLREKDDSLKSIQKEKIRIETELRESLVLREDTLNAVHQEEMRNVSNLLSQKELEVNYLMKSKEDVKLELNNELRLMSMVLYEAGLQMMQINRALKGDKSWINRKRAMKNT